EVAGRRVVRVARAGRPLLTLHSLYPLGALRSLGPLWALRPLDAPLKGGLARLAVRHRVVDDAEGSAALRVAAVDHAAVRDRRVGDASHKSHAGNGDRHEQSQLHLTSFRSYPARGGAGFLLPSSAISRT